MDIRQLPDTIATAMLATGYELDETAVDHELVHGSTITGRMIRSAASGFVVGAMPWVFLDLIVGGRRQRTEQEHLLLGDETLRNDSRPSGR